MTHELVINAPHCSHCGKQAPDCHCTPNRRNSNMPSFDPDDILPLPAINFSTNQESYPSEQEGLPLPRMNFEGAPIDPGKKDRITEMKEEDERVHRENQRRLGLITNDDDDILPLPRMDFS